MQTNGTIEEKNEEKREGNRKNGNRNESKTGKLEKRIKDGEEKEAFVSRDHENGILFYLISW